MKGTAVKDRMDVRKEFEILTYYEQVDQLFVNYFIARDRFAVGVKGAQRQGSFVARVQDGRLNIDTETVFRTIWHLQNKCHAAARAFARLIHMDVRIHRAGPIERARQIWFFLRCR